MEMNRTRYTPGLGALVLSREIKAEMVRRGITTTALAERLGARRATLTNKLNGHTPMSTAEFLTISNELGIHASALMTRAEQSIPFMETHRTQIIQNEAQ